MGLVTGSVGVCVYVRGQASAEVVPCHSAKFTEAHMEVMDSVLHVQLQQSPP